MVDKDKPTTTTPSESKEIRISQEPNRPTEEPVVFRVPSGIDPKSEALSILAASAAAGRAAYDAAQAAKPRIRGSSNPELPPTPADYGANRRDETPALRQTIERAVQDQKVHKQSMPPQLSSSQPTEPPLHGPDGPLPRTWREAIPYVVWVVLVLGFGLELVSAFVHGQWIHFGVAAVGLVVLMTAALHWRQAVSWVRALSPNAAGGILALILLSMALSPFIEERRWPFFGWFQATAPGPSANLPKQSASSIRYSEEALAMATESIRNQLSEAQSNLAAITADRNKLRDQLAAIPKPPPYVNAFHAQADKWRVAELLRHQLRNVVGLSTECRITIVQTPVSYAEDFAADFKQILDMVDWKYESRLATAPVDKGISVRANSDDPKSRGCADSLVNSFRNNVRNDPHRWFTRVNVPEYLKACPSGCVEIDFGIEESQ